MENKKCKNLVVMLHGYGSNGDDLASLQPFFETVLKDTHFYSPDGLESCEMGFGYQWFSLMDRSDAAMMRELKVKAESARKMIEEKAASLDLGLEDTILLGFSQGTMLSIYLALSSKVPYKAVIGFSGRLYQPEQVSNTKTPMCLVHGMEDDVVPASSIIAAQKTLESLGITVSALQIPRLSHSIDMQGIKFAADFIKDIK